MRAMSFAATIPQILNRSKTVTRRVGWTNLQPGQQLWAVEKAMGLKKGEPHRRLAAIEVVLVTREPLDAITPSDVAAEGFPAMTTAEFIAMFCTMNKSASTSTITRIEFTYPMATKWPM